MMNLKQYRIEIEMTQKRLSECTGISVRQIRDIESGHINPRHIKADTAIRLAHVFSVTVEELLGAIVLDSGKAVYASEFEPFTPTQPEA